MKKKSTSKKTLASILLLALLFVFTNLSAQIVISQWNNFVSAPANGQFLATAGIASNRGAAILTREDVNGINFAVPTGGIASSTGWALDKYWEATFETTGYESLTVTSKQMGSNTGPSGFKIQYSIGNSGVWTDLPGATAIVVGTSYTNTTGAPTDLSLPAAMEDQASVSLRWVCTSIAPVNPSSTFGAGGTNRLDIVVSGTAKSGVVDPVINVSPTTLRFTPLSVSNTKTFSVTGINLNGPIQITSNNSFFFIPSLSLPATGGLATVRFTGATAQTGKITLQSGTANAVINLIAMLSDTGNDGTKEHPFTVAEGSAPTLQGSIDTLWVKGYIVGCVKAGTTSVTTADSVLIGVTSGFNSRTNVLIADNAGELDYKNCMAVSLTASSPLRTNVNLVDHSENIGKLLNVKGKLYAYFSLPGSRDNTGYDFVLGNVTGLKPAIIPELNVYAENGTIFVKNLKGTANIRIYDLTGKLLIKTSATEIPFAQHGFYIVKVNNQTFKIINKF
ncbi:MAG: T9SS type A sorting domain-containing protein [Candidatus Azobacteroides sp.]|nr:T9SS type A sorting domain-containing protein [Candidatus Azobacteroides sp.]